MLPLESTLTLITSPQCPPFILFGNTGQPATKRYGLGSSVGFGYWVSCAQAAPLTAAIVASTTISVNALLPVRFTTSIPSVVPGNLTQRARRHRTPQEEVVTCRVWPDAGQKC